jgi:hypothetical protein
VYDSLSRDIAETTNASTHDGAPEAWSENTQEEYYESLLEEPVMSSCQDWAETLLLAISWMKVHDWRAILSQMWLLE